MDARDEPDRSMVLSDDSPKISVQMDSYCLSSRVMRCVVRDSDAAV